MRVVMDFSSNQILQVEKTPEVGVPKVFNGRYTIPIPDGAAFSTDDLPPTPTPQDVAALAAAGLLAQFPMYDNIAYNFLLDAGDVADLDLSPAPAVSPIGGLPVLTRAQTGRGIGPLPLGQFPNMTALLPVNNRVAPPRRGCLVTDTIDITIPTGGAGADEFLLWWHIFQFDVNDDWATDFGPLAGINTPTEKRIAEYDQEPPELAVHISHDDGVTWTPIGRLEPTDLTVFDTSVRLAFLHNGFSTRIYLAAYAVMF